MKNREININPEINGKEWAIREIEDYLFRGAYQPIGADCSGDSRGACARNNAAKCGEFSCCQEAVEAAGEDKTCPKYVSPEEARKEAEEFYEKVKDLKEFKFNEDKDLCYSRDFIDKSGEYIEPDFRLCMETDRGTKYLVWYSPEKLKDALVLIREVDKKNDDGKFEFVLPHELSEEQKEKLREFCQEYDIGFPEGV